MWQELAGSQHVASGLRCYEFDHLKILGLPFFLQKSERGGCSSNLLTGHLFGSCFTAQKPDVFFRSSSGVFFVCELAGGYYIGQNIAAAHDISVTLGLMG